MCDHAILLQQVLAWSKFAALLPAMPPPFATRLAERILAAVRAAPIVTSRDPLEVVRVSIGIAGLDPATLVAGMDRKATADEWLSRAHAALHQAKRDGGDRCIAR